MHSEFPGRPRLHKGALLVYPSQTPGPRPAVIVFQFNPEQIRRSLEKRAAPSPSSSVGGAREDVLRVLGPPIETVNLTVELDAADQLETPLLNPVAVAHGLHPVLATLELLLYPPTALIDELLALEETGKVQVCPADIPLTLLVWGPSRVMPVLLNSFSVTEQAFDQDLNPIQAQVELGFRVLTYMELEQSTVGRNSYMAYQARKEALAALYSPVSVQAGGPAPL